MIIAGLVLAGIGALVHCYIFWLEAVAWTSPRARRVFGLSADHARITAPLALNQAFYNLFLAVEVAVGIVLVAAGARAIGLTAVLIGAGSMVLAALVLVVSDRSKARAAAVQGVVPLLGVAILVLCLTLRSL